MVLIGYWPLNETSGTTAYDRSGQNNHGTVNGATTGANGITGSNAYQFDGTDDYVNCGQLGAFWTGSWTISAWIKTDTDHKGHIFGGDDEASADRVFQFRKQPTGEIRFLYSIGGGGYEILTSDISNNEWHYVVAVHNSSSGTEVFVDSVIEGANGNVNSQNKNPDICVGRRHPNDSTGSFDGRIAEVRVYNHALTKQEVQYLYQVSKTGKTVTSKRS